MRIFRKILLFLPLLIICGTGCIAPQPGGKPALQTQGEVVLYLQPFPQNTQNLRFTIQSIAARRPDGTAIPLRLHFQDFLGSALIGRQKRLAGGTLPPGNYSGISLQIDRAFLMGEEGESEMLLSDPEIIVQQPFEVFRRQATALFLSLDTSGIRPGDFVFQPQFSLAESSRQLFNLYGYASNSGSNLITVFNKTTMQVTDSVATGLRPRGMAIDPRRRRLFVACSGDNRIEEIDILKNAVVGRIQLRLGDEPLDLAITPDGRLLVSANYGSNSVSIIDAGSRIEMERVTVGRKPTDAVIDTSGSRVYVVNSFSNSVSVVDLARSALAGALAVESTPLRAALETRSRRLFVIHRDSPNLSVIDTDTMRLVEKIFAGIGAFSLTSDPQTGLVYVGYRSGDISVVDPSALMFVDTLALPGGVAHLEIDNQENSLFALQPEKRTLTKINLISKRTQSVLEVGEDAYAVALVGER
jgi:YVTN family beta-propeller protein